ncbi:DUF6268 family outer membrane beta-barrel protein [Chryseobacterium sp.]|uniref:DUF6268 family outer membrane beta-barrel protein n=1 Tax=Chryseobacterium sp. TaxID=1871047 RepID=UPI0025C40155|nr:DUF6268 family outer membrane beta-barrel protein [Chryseobacterium sp.]
MKNLLKCRLLFICSAIPVLSFAQISDSSNVSKKVESYLPERFPRARTFNVEYTQLMPYKFDSQLNNVDLPENKVKNMYHIKATANINLMRRNNWSIGTTLLYKYTSLEVENPDQVFGMQENNKMDFHYHTESLNFMYYSRLFNKPVIYTVSAMVDGSEQHFERIKGMASGTLVLKSTPKTKMTLGVVAFADTSMKIPAFVTFTYEHTFNNGWVADIILPQKVELRKDFSQNSRLAIGGGMEGTTFYLYQPGKTYEFRQMEINGGITYEHRFGPLIGTVKTGAKFIGMARIFDKNDTFEDYFYKANPKPAFYFNIGLSYNIFERSKR